MAIVLNGDTGISSIGTLTGVTSISSAAANTPVVMQDSGSNTNTCRAWVNFNGTGTVAIRASFNVNSITDNGTGDYTVIFTNAMPDINYSVACVGMRNSASGSGAAGPYVCVFGSATYSDAFVTTSIRVQTKTDNGSMEDLNSVSVSVFR